MLPLVRNKAPIGPDPQSALQTVKEAAKGMNVLSRPVTSGVSATQNAPADLEDAYNFEDAYIRPLKIFDSVIEKPADIHPYAKIALRVLSCASKMVIAQSVRDQATHRLVDKLDQVDGFMIQDETLGQISSMRGILGQISQQTLGCASFIRDNAETRSFWKRLGKDILTETNNEIQQYSDVLDALTQNIRDQVARDVAIYVHRTGEQLDLSDITYAAGAGLDTGKLCLPRTRTDVLSQITDWVNSTRDDVPRVLWLSGHAGKSKSAIAHMIASWFPTREGLIHVITSTDIEKRTVVTKRTLDIVQQWQRLLMEPLQKLSASTVGHVVVVIDALDESGGVETGRHLLRVLTRKLAVLKITELPANLRIIVTSRPLHDIDKELGDAQHIRQMPIDDFPVEFAERDIRTYISKELEELSDMYIGNNEIAHLANKADGLVEWARLACGYVDQTSAAIERFNTVVNRDPSERHDLLYDMYRLMLKEILGAGASTNVRNQQSLRTKALTRFRFVMEQILSATEPLPLASLNVMRRRPPDTAGCGEVEVVAKSMGSLLSGTTTQHSPMRPLHASFHEFLTDPECSGDFFIHVSRVRRNLAFASLRTLGREIELKSAFPLIAQWLKGQSGYQDVSSTAMDVKRFIQVFSGMILHSTPHLYVSALLLSPVNSALSSTFSARFPNSLRLASGRDINWTAVQTLICGHADAVY
ncbi:hypothetical protein BDR05DRAFT_1003471 [Suillus weaverae]|nr:hypothetical protein BDR05DRAFT_1003471 [Suillus weaverae]